MMLSILICHLPEYEHFRVRLMNVLQPQLDRHPDCELLIDSTGREMPTGRKRNILIDRASGKYFVFIDVDDIVSDFYLDKVMEALQSNPDCVTYEGIITENGGPEKQWIIKLGSEYKDTPNCYYRWPNHICPIRKEAVKNFKFPDKWLGEDFEWSKRLSESRVLKTEVHIPLKMYRYEYFDKKK